MCYLRIHSNATHSRWKDVVEISWRHLFPAGEPRRASAPLRDGKALSETYPVRSNGALQCRYYRARENAGMGPVRKGRKAGGRSEKDGLRALEMDLVKHWFRSASREEVARLGLEQRVGEEEHAFLMRMRRSYRENSVFWRLLMSLKQAGMAPTANF